MGNPIEKVELFDFTKAADFPPKNLDTIPEGDPLWAFHVGRRRDHLYSEADKTTGTWNAQLAEYLHDTGAYAESFTASNRARSIAEANGDDRLQARALLVHVGSELETGAAKNASAHIAQLENLALRSQDRYVLGAFNYLQAAYVVYGGTDPPDTFVPTIKHSKDAASDFESCGEFDLAILALTVVANALIRTGAYIPAIKEVEQGMDLAIRH